MKNKQQDIAEKTAQIFLDIGAVSFRFNPPYTFTSGLKSPIYLDNRIVPSYPKERNKIIQTYLEIIKRNVGLDNVDYISATASAAIPHGSLIADKLNLPLVFVRPTTKTYGKGNKLEG
jgi:orotate phosphoribosyltransferase